MPSLLERAQKLVATEDHLRDAGCELTDSETDLARLVVEAAEMMAEAAPMIDAEWGPGDELAERMNTWLRKVEEP